MRNYLYFHYLLEKEVDRETLLMLGSCGTMEMLNSCGLSTLKHQLLLCKLIVGSQAGSQSVDTNPATSNSQNADPIARKQTRSSKLTLQGMRDVDKRMYLMKSVIATSRCIAFYYYTDYLLGGTWYPQRLQRSGQEIIFLISTIIKCYEKSCKGACKILFNGRFR